MYVVFFLFSLILLGTGITKKSANWMIPSGILFGIALASALADESELFGDGDVNTRGAISICLFPYNSRLEQSNPKVWLYQPHS